jgi:hypothetical protein
MADGCIKSGYLCKITFDNAQEIIYKPQVELIQRDARTMSPFHQLVSHCNLCLSSLCYGILSLAECYDL